MRNQQLVQKLIQEIEEAFSDTSYPGKEIGDELELKHFIGKKWEDLTLEDVNSNDSLHFFTATALRYYIPAYLIAVLQYPELRRDIRSALIQDLGPGLDPNWRDQEVKLYTIFSPVQRAAIRHFFESYAQIFPFPTGDFSTTQKNIRDKRKRALEECVEYWQLYG